MYESAIPEGDKRFNEFYTEFIPNTREYRFHVFDGEVIRVQGKYHDCPEQQSNPYIKNHAQGFRFRAPDREPNRDRSDAAINAVAALGLVHGAVDLVIGAVDRSCYILEVNTAPACSPLTLRAYCEAFSARLGLNPNWDLLDDPEALRRRPVAVRRRSSTRPYTDRTPIG